MITVPQSSEEVDKMMTELDRFWRMIARSNAFDRELLIELINAAYDDVVFNLIGNILHVQFRGAQPIEVPLLKYAEPEKQKTYDELKKEWL